MSTADATVQIRLNGESHTLPMGHSLAALIDRLGLSPQSALVEHNGTALFRDEWDRIRLEEDDRVEILRIVAGG